MRLPEISRRFVDWLVIAVAAINVLVLGVVVGVLITNSRQTAKFQAEQLRTSRAVVRCALTEEFRILQKMSRELGITIETTAPSVQGIDCDEVLNRPLGRP
jgi:hypothetical protein